MGNGSGATVAVDSKDLPRGRRKRNKNNALASHQRQSKKKQEKAKEVHDDDEYLGFTPSAWDEVAADTDWDDCFANSAYLNVDFGWLKEQHFGWLKDVTYSKKLAERKAWLGTDKK